MNIGEGLKAQTNLRIEFTCETCGAPYFVLRGNLKNRKTSKCKSCVLTERNKSDAMREASRKVGLLSPSEDARKKLREYQEKIWTPEKRLSRSGEGNPAWMGGRSKRHGYVVVRCPDHPRATQKGKYVFEHVLVMEGHLGRYLMPDEVVHHINGNRADNRLENLLLTTQSEHIRIHYLQGEMTR